MQFASSTGGKGDLRSDGASRSMLRLPGCCQHLLTSPLACRDTEQAAYGGGGGRLANQQPWPVSLVSLVSWRQAWGCCACLDMVPICLQPCCLLRAASNTAPVPASAFTPSKAEPEELQVRCWCLCAFGTRFSIG